MSASDEPSAVVVDSAAQTPSRRVAYRAGTHVLRLLVIVALVAAALGAGWQADRLAHRDRAVDDLYAGQRAAAREIARRVALGGDAAAAARIEELARSATEVLVVADLPEVEHDRWTGSFAVDGDLARIGERWGILDDATRRWRESRERVAGLRGDVDAFQSIATGILVTSDELVEALVAADAPSRTLQLAGRQLMLMQRINTNVRRLLEAGEGVVAAADRFGRDAVLFGQNNNALLHGNRDAHIGRVENPEARQVLEQLGREFRAASEVIERLLALAGAIAAGERIEQELLTTVDTLVATVDAARRHYREQAAARPDFREVALLLALAAVLVAALAAAGIVVDARAVRAARRRWEEEAAGWSDARERREDQAADEAARLQLRCEALAVAVGDLRDGRLAGPYPEGEPPLDVVVDALAAAGTALAARVGGLREHAGEASRALERARDSGSRLRSGLERQADELPGAMQACEGLAQGSEALVAGSRELGDVAQRARATLDALDSASRESLPQVEAVATAMRETASYVQQLVEATAQVRELSAVVDELGDQSKMLSLNVAIQASMDTPAGRALGNFADDVQRLAERARQANRRIESANDALRKAADDAADAVKRGRWAGGNATRGMQVLAGQREATAALADRLRALDESLSSAVREHGERAAAARDAVHSLRDVVEQARAAALGNADSVVQLGDSLRRVVAGLDEFRTAPPAPREVVALDARRDDEADAPPDAVEPAERAESRG